MVVLAMRALPLMNLAIPSGWSALAGDITDRVVADEALRLSESRYRQLVDMLPTAIFVSRRQHDTVR